MLRITPIYGSRWDADGPSKLGSCTLVEYANVKVLINVGLTPTPEYDFSSLPPHDCLLVSDSTLEHMGGLPAYHQQHPHVPMYATFPTVKMGQMTCYDHHANVCLDGGVCPFSLKEMDKAFADLITIKYAQTLLLPPHKPQVAITAHRAGHVVGGAFYVMQRLQDETVVVVTATYHIAKELHLDSSTLLQHGSTPDVLITHPGGPAMTTLSNLYKQKKLVPPRVTQSERQLVEHVLSVLRRDGNVLIPVDASGRVLELILLLSQHWDRHRLQGTYNLVWLGSMVVNTLEFCRSQLEWMSTVLGNQFDTQGKGHPYALNGVQLCTSIGELDLVLANGNPTVVLASGLSLDHGPARDLLVKWADNDNNAVIFTDSSQCHARPWIRHAKTNANVATTTTTTAASTSTVTMTTTTATPGTTTAPAVPTSVVAVATEPQPEETQDDNDPNNTNANSTMFLAAAIGEADVSEFTASYQLLRHWSNAQLQDREMEDSVWVHVLVPHRAPLAGQELKAFLEQEEAGRVFKRKQEEERAMLRQVELAKGRLRLGEEEPKELSSLSSKSPNNMAAAATAAKPKKKSRFDSSLFLKFSKPLHLTFEVREEAVGIGQTDSTAKFGIGETVGNSEVLEDDYGIAVIPEHFIDIVTGVDPSKFAGGSGRIGEEVLRRGFGFGVVDNAKGGKTTKRKNNDDDMEEGGEEEDERGLEAADLSEGRGIIRGRNGRPPTKVMTVPRRLQVFAEIAYIPLEGRVDSRAARQSVRALQPRQVVVLGGPKDKANDQTEQQQDGDEEQTIKVVDEVQLLASAAEAFTASNTVVQTPSDFETVELDVGHAAYSVRLIDAPYASRDEKQADNAEPPEPIEPYEAKLGACTVSLLDYVATGQRVALDGSIVLAPRAKSSKPPSIYLSDGEVLLTDLRSELIAQGMKAEYSAHTGYSQLVVNSKIVVRKDQDSGKVDVEGPLCEDFFTVRSVVCGQYVTLY